MRILGFLVLCALIPVLHAAPAKGPLDTPAAISDRIKSIRADSVSWRKIAWKSCLLEGLAEAQQTGKPLMIWCYIDRPVGDTRC